MGKRTRGNGQGTVFKMPNGKWRAEVTLGWKKQEDGTEKRVVKTKSGFKLKKDAIAALPGLFQNPIDIDLSITFSEIYEKWSKGHFDKVTRDTKNCYTSAYNHSKDLYYKPFVSLKTDDYQSVIDACNLGRRTKENMKALYTCVYDYAIENDYCSKNYASFVKLPKRESGTKDAWTQEEIEKLWKDYKDGNKFTGYMLTMIYTGMRYGEISTVLKSNIHLSERYMIGGIKTEAGTNRIIPISNQIYPVVAELYLSADNKLLDMPEKTFYTLFRETLRRSGVRELSPHSCRHTFSTMAAKAGIPPALIMAIAGHTNYETTMQYTHVQKIQEMLDAVNSISKASSSSE